MSQAWLLQGARDLIQTALELDANSCEVRIDGKPPPACGQLFVAVHPGRWGPGPDGADYGTDEVFGVQVTLTHRAGYSPNDRGGKLWLEQVEPRLRLIKNALAGPDRYEVLRLANEVHGTIATSADPDAPVWPGGLVEPLRFQDGGTPTEQGPEWFGAETVEAVGKWANAGVSQTMSFGEARRVQGNMDQGVT